MQKVGAFQMSEDPKLKEIEIKYGFYFLSRSIVFIYKYITNIYKFILHFFSVSCIVCMCKVEAR